MASNAKDKKKDKKKTSVKGKEKEKGKFLSNSVVEDSDVEGEGPGNTYQPPAGFVLSKDYIDSDDFDYDTLKDNEDLELWLIRVPENVKPKHFENVRVSLPTSSVSETIGTLSRKTVDYDIWSVRDEGADQTSRVGGDEVLGLSCLVPRKRKNGHLFTAPKPVARHLVLSAQAVLPSPPSSDPEIPISGPYKGPGRYRHPKHLLKHRFLPCGTVIDPVDSPNVGMEVDAAVNEPSPTQATHTKAAKEGRPEKKRKVDGESTKKKKTKTVS